MKKVFFGGSRKLSRLNKAIRERADNIISSGYMILLGDANGADRAMQKYLAEKSYPHVLVFCAGDTCRNNIGNWPTRFIISDRVRKDFQHYANRDKKMSEEADYGFMLWDGQSKGTLNNILNLIECHKTVLVYFAPQREYFSIKSGPDLISLLSLCRREIVERLDRFLLLRQRINIEPSQLNFAQQPLDFDA